MIGRKLFIFVFSTKFTDCSYETYIYGKVWSRTIVSLIIGTFVCERKKLRRFESRVSYFMSRSCMVAIFHACGLLKLKFVYSNAKCKYFLYFGLRRLWVMPFEAVCCCPFHDEWRHGKVISQQLRCCTREETSFFSVAAEETKNKGRKRKICISCRSRLEVEAKCQKLEVGTLL